MKTGLVGSGLWTARWYPYSAASVELTRERVCVIVVDQMGNSSFSFGEFAMAMQDGHVPCGGGLQSK